jgi:hypothetical protein
MSGSTTHPTIIVLISLYFLILHAFNRIVKEAYMDEIFRELIITLLDSS